MLPLIKKKKAEGATVISNKGDFSPGERMLIWIESPHDDSGIYSSGEPNNLKYVAL